MYYYKVFFSYKEDGVYRESFDFCFADCASEAAEITRLEYADLPSLCIERVYVDAGCSWEAREWED